MSRLLKRRALNKSEAERKVIAEEIAFAHLNILVQRARNGKGYKLQLRRFKQALEDAPHIKEVIMAAINSDPTILNPAEHLAVPKITEFPLLNRAGIGVNPEAAS